MTAQHQILWHGTQQESFDLINSISRNCVCEFGPMGVRTYTCSPHQMLTNDQRALDGLLFVRRMVERLRAEEWGTSSGRRGAATPTRIEGLFSDKRIPEHTTATS